MLSPEIKGEPVWSKEVLDLISAGDIQPISRIKIYRRHNNQEYETEVTNVLSYDVSEDRQFGAASLSLTATNENGIYSYGNTDSHHNKLLTRSSKKRFVIFFYLVELMKTQLFKVEI